MDWNIIIEYIRPELFILIPFIWILGLFFKKAPEWKADWLIPFILMAIAVVFAVLWLALYLGEGFGGAVILYGIVQGVIIAGLAVFGNELIKQFTTKRTEDAGGD